jgi:hypothetical protein
MLYRLTSRQDLKQRGGDKGGKQAMGERGSSMSGNSTLNIEHLSSVEHFLKRRGR